MEQQHGRPDDRTHPHESHGRHRPAEGHGHAPGHGHHKSAPPVDPASVPAGTQWTCPMHPEIVRDGPGSCPICGMALEPMTVTAATGPNPGLADMTRRFWIALVLTLPVLVLEMGGHRFGLHRLVSPPWSGWIQLVLTTPLVLWRGWPF